MPNTIAILLKGIRPVTVQGLGDGVTQRRTSKTHADEVTLLISGSAIDEAIPAMQDREVVDEVHITLLGGELEFGSTCNGLDSVQCFDLLGVEGWQASLARMSQGAHERDTAKVHDKLAVEMEENRAAMISREGKRPILTGQDSDEIRSGSSQKVVDGGSGGNDTLPARSGRASSEPGYDVSRLLIVERDGIRGVAVVVLVGLVGDNVDKHVSLPVLAATLVGNVGRDTHVGKGQILDGEIRRFQTADGREATAVVYIKAELPQLLAKAG